LSSIVTIKSYATELYEHDRVQKAVQAVVASEEDSFRATMKFADVGQLLFFSGWVASLTVGGLLLRKNALSQNAFSTLIYMIPQLVESFYGIDELFDNRQKATEAAQRVLALLSEPITLVDGARVLPDRGVEREIRFSKVSFGYDEREAVLRELDLTIPANQITAIVGGTGSGKSTILKLLMRLYELNAGSISVDGTELRELAVHGLRRAIGYVSQEVYLFNGTIWENLTYGHPSATMAEVRRAAQLAEAASFIEELPQGYDTVVGDYGAKLSGGQRQRISIARAMLKQPRILLLDEATSAVDNETELAIQRAIQRVSVGRTTVIVAHRLSTIRHAHTILVMKDGRIAERGSHDELLQLDGAYAAMWKVQTGESIVTTTGEAAREEADEAVGGSQSDRLYRDSTVSRAIYAAGREH
ncbi:MAG TPA: ABC transporter ATP-binding protein, partial [Polyangiaceae bacterium]|nr:ABC transporter ATP-binding protein [Polyangiaceae bacterium]